MTKKQTNKKIDDQLVLISSIKPTWFCLAFKTQH